MRLEAQASRRTAAKQAATLVPAGGCVNVEANSNRTSENARPPPAPPWERGEQPYRKTTLFGGGRLGRGVALEAGFLGSLGHPVADAHELQNGPGSCVAQTGLRQP